MSERERGKRDIGWPLKANAAQEEPKLMSRNERRERERNASIE